uniref:Uncharacterized protein n=1 Tax=viral metagenome TaxID=1070528 RepID=A0A6M3LQT8_9ZZZZ
MLNKAENRYLLIFAVIMIVGVLILGVLASCATRVEAYSPAITVWTQLIEVEKVRWIVPQPFEDKQEMLDFLDYYRANKTFIFTVGADGKADFNNIENNCIDMAQDLKRMAAEQGYDFDTEVLSIREMTAI